MTNEFLTKGLENDRYMKARQLVEQFDKEVVVALRSIGEEMVSRNRGSFDESATARESTSTASNTFPFARVDYPLSRFRSRDDDTRLVLNVHLYWDDPRNYTRQDIDGALRALGYKIKHIADSDEQRVVEETRDWPIRTAENRFGGETAFYEHVRSAEDIDETGERLVEHFSAFVGDYGVPRDE